MEDIKLKFKELRQNVEKLSPEERKAAWALFSRFGIDISESDSSLTGTKPSGFTLEGKFYPADHNRDIFLKVCEIAAAKNPNNHHLFLEIKGRTRRYFSTNHKDISSSDYRKINGTNIFAELNENASTLHKRSEQVLAKFGMDLSTFKIN